MANIIFEVGKAVVYISRHLEWCKGALHKDHPKQKIFIIKDSLSYGFYAIKYNDVREYVSKSDRKLLLKRKKAKSAASDLLRAEKIENIAKPVAMERWRKIKSKNKKRAKGKRNVVSKNIKKA